MSILASYVDCGSRPIPANLDTRSLEIDRRRLCMIERATDFHSDVIKKSWSNGQHFKQRILASDYCGETLGLTCMAFIATASVRCPRRSFRMPGMQSTGFCSSTLALRPGRRTQGTIRIRHIRCTRAFCRDEDVE
jgi:hypothetical protein